MPYPLLCPPCRLPAVPPCLLPHARRSRPPARRAQSDRVNWASRDLRYLLHDEYERRFSQWLKEARRVNSLGAARQHSSRGEGGDLLVSYGSHRELQSMCKQLGLMEDLKAGIPRTAYHGVILIRIGGRRVFIAPSYKVDQEIVPLKSA